jgi:hypothetical protein
MIAKQIKGAGFRGVLNYMEAKVNEGVGQLIDSNMLGQGAGELSKEFGMIRSLKPNLEKVVYHTALSIGHDESLTDKEFVNLAKEYLTQMGFANSQYAIYKHTDRDHPHIHIIANRVSLDGKVVSDKWDYKRSENIVRSLEVKYGLRETKCSHEVQKASMSKGQVEFFRRTHAIPVKKQLQIAVSDALSNSNSLVGFEQKLTEYGVSLKLHENSNSKVFGVSFELDGICFKGSALGKMYSWNNLSAQITNNHERNRRSSQEDGRGTQENTRWSGRTSTKDQLGEYRGVNAGNASIGSNNEKLSERFTSGGFEYSRATSECTQNDSTTRGDSWNTVQQDESTRKVEHDHQSKNVSAISAEQRGNGSSHISGIVLPIIPSKKGDDDDDESNEKKKKRNYEIGM